MEAQKFCLKWDGFQGTVTSVFDHLRQDAELVDITLCCDGQRVRAHRMMLSACSPYFRDLFKDLPCQQLVVFLKDTSASDLHAIVEFMYKGSVNVAQSQLASFIKTAEMLQVQGLSGGDDKPEPPSPGPRPEPSRWTQPQQQPASPAAAVRRAADCSPAEPRHKRRRAAEPPLPPPELTPPEVPDSTPPPPPPPPPPPAPVPAAVDAPQSAHVPEQEPPQFENAVKVEKVDVDLTLDDDDAGGADLEAALGHVAHYEGYDPGSDHSLSADGQMFSAGGTDPLTGNAIGTGGPFTPGPSQRTGEDGSQAGPCTCHICGASYSYRRNLISHMKRHQGLTTCPLCLKELAVVRNMRQHMVSKHGMTEEEAVGMANKRMTAARWAAMNVATAPPVLRPDPNN